VSLPDLKRVLAMHGRVRGLALVLAVAFGSELHAQETPERCLVELSRMSVAARDSALRSLEANEIALTGFVRDEATGAPVRDITVSVVGTHLQAPTGEDGGYLIRHVNQAANLPSRPMVKACEIGWDYLTEIREVRLTSPSDGTVVVIDGQTMSNPGHAVRLDFLVRRRPGVFE
jgi:hypothetical protein